MHDPDHTYRSARLVDSYGTVLFPFDVPGFIAALDRHDYVLATELSQSGSGLGAQRIEVSGIVARKGDIAVYLNTERHSMGVVAKQSSVLPEEMKPLQSILTEELGTDLAAVVRYSEFAASLIVRADKDPLESVYRQFESHQLVQRLSGILNTPVAPFGIRLGSARQDPNQVDWTELRVEPLVAAARSRYVVEAIFRRAGRDEVLRFTADFDATLRTVLRALEENR